MRYSLDLLQSWWGLAKSSFLLSLSCLVVSWWLGWLKMVSWSERAYQTTDHPIFLTFNHLLYFNLIRCPKSIPSHAPPATHYHPHQRISYTSSPFSVSSSSVSSHVVGKCAKTGNAWYTSCTITSFSWDGQPGVCWGWPSGWSSSHSRPRDRRKVSLWCGPLSDRRNCATCGRTFYSLGSRILIFSLVSKFLDFYIEALWTCA